MVDHEFPEQLTQEFKRLYNESAELQAELNGLVDIGQENFEKIMTSNNFERYKSLITAMSVTSRKTSDTFDALNAICLAGMEKSDGYKKYLKSISEIQEEINQARQQSLSYIEKLPYSIDEGWVHGGKISIGRRLINYIPAYLLVFPGLYAQKKKADYKAFLRDYKKLSDLHKEAKSSEKWDIGEDIKKSYKTLKSFIRITRGIYRSYNRTERRVMKICKNNNLSRVEISTGDIYRHLDKYHSRKKELRAAA